MKAQFSLEVQPPVGDPSWSPHTHVLMNSINWTQWVTKTKDMKLDEKMCWGVLAEGVGERERAWI